MRLGTVVFWGMIGVTLFGIFLTPVFYVTIRWIGSKLGMRPPHHLPPPPDASIYGKAGNGGHAAMGSDDGGHDPARELVHK